jgi:hypothetical protein
MKKIPAIQFLLLIVTVLYCFTECKKHSPQVNTTTPIDSSNYLLHDKPLSIIQAFVKGNWVLQYEQGGITGGTFPQTNFF